LEAEGSSQIDIDVSGVPGYQVIYTSREATCTTGEVDGEPMPPGAFTINILARCNSEAEEAVFRLAETDEDCKISFEYSGQAACQVNWERYDTNRTAKRAAECVGLILILAGLALATQGFRSGIWVFAILVFFTVFGLMYSLLAILVLEELFTSTMVLLAVISSGVVGGIVAWLVKRSKDRYFTGRKCLQGLLGFWVAACISMPLVPLFGPSNWIRLLTYVASGLVGALVGVKAAARMGDGYQPLATAFIGSYAVVRGTSLIVGGFMNEITVGFAEDRIA